MQFNISYNQNKNHCEHETKWEMGTHHQKLQVCVICQEHSNNHCNVQRHLRLGYNSVECEVNTFWTHHLKLSIVAQQGEEPEEKTSS